MTNSMYIAIFCHYYVYRFNWSTPIRDIIGDSFALYNDELTYQTTLEDILSHRTGIPDYFLLLVAGYPYIVTRQQVIW